MSTIKTAIELEVKEPNLKGFRQQLKQLTIEAQQAVIQFGEFSPEAVKAAQRVAELRDRMDDFNDRVSAVNPDKFAQLNTVVSSVANGFQAAQGAMVLLGGTTQSVEKTFVKLQAAMALSQGLEGLGKVQQQLRQIIASASTLQKVMAGTLGVIVLIVANFQRIVQLIPGFQKVADVLKEIGFAISDFFGLGYRETAQYKAFKANNDLVIAEIEKRIAILGTQKNTELDIFDARKELAKAELKDIEQQLALQVDMDEEQKQQLILQQKKLNDSLEIIDKERIRFIDDKNKEIQENDREHSKVLLEIERQKNNETIKTDNVFFKNRNAKEQSEFLKRLHLINEQNLKTLQQLDDAEKAELKQFEGNQIQKQKIKKYYDLLRLEENRKNNELITDEEKKYALIRQQLQIESDLQIRDAKIQIAKSTVDSLNSLAEITINNQDKLAKVRKGIALVEIAVDTGMAISSLNAEAAKVSAQMAGVLGPATPIFTASYYAQGIARILANVAKAKQILTTKSPSVSGIGGGVASPNISTPTPSMVTGSSLPQDTQGGKVYVLEGDIRRTQQRVGMNRGVSVVE